MAAPGSRDTEIIIQASVVAKVDGVPTEQISDVAVLWGSVEQRPPQDEIINGVRISHPAARLRFDYLDAEIITDASLFDVNGRAYRVRSIDRDDDRRRTVIVDVEGVSHSPDASKAEWSDKMRRGEVVVIQNRSARPFKETHVRAIAETLPPDEIVGGLTQGARRYFVFADDVDPAFGPIERGHYLAVRNDLLFIESVDDVTERVGGDLIVYILITRGIVNGKLG